MKEIMSETAFVYLWYVASTKKFYLGKTNGNDSYYTHSAQSSEEFRSIVPHSKRPITERREFFENMPKGISRKEIAHGTVEEMCILENKLLINRKNRCWNRYYNESLGDPRYVDQWGDNNSQWKGGVWANDPVAYAKEYEQTPKRKAYNKKRDQTPERKAYMKEYRQTPEYKASRPLREVKYRAKKKAETGFTRGYSQAKNKTETQGEGTLKAFLR